MQDFFNDKCRPVCEPVGMPDGYVIFNDDGIPTALDTPTLTPGPTLTIGGEVIKYNDIIGVTLICPQDAVAQRDTVTPQQFPNTDCCGDKVCYGITLSFKDDCGTPDQEVYNVCLEGTQTATSVVTALKAAMSESAIVDVSGTTTLVIDAKTAGKGFTTIVDGTILTVAHTIANVIETGTAAWLESLGVPSDQIEASSDYGTVLITYRIFSDSGADIEKITVKNFTLAVFVETGGAAESAILTDTDALCDILDGTYSDATQYYAKVVVGACPCS